MKCPMKFNGIKPIDPMLICDEECDHECAWLLAIKNSEHAPVEAYVCALAAYVAKAHSDKWIQNFVKGGE